MPPVLLAAGAVVAWTLFAFGGAYPWVVAPAAVGCLMVASLGYVRARDRALDGFRDVRSALAVCLGAAALQVLPLPSGILTMVSPGARFANAPTSVVRGEWVPLSLAPWATAAAIAWWTCLSFIVYGVTRVTEARQLWRLVMGIQWIAVALTLLALLQGNNPLVYGVWPPAGVNQAMGPFINRNHFASWLLLAIGLGVGLYCRLVEDRVPSSARGWRGVAIAIGSREGSQMLIVGFGLLTMGVGLTASLSRSGVLGLAAVVASMAAFNLHRQRGSAGRRFVPGYAAVMAVLVVSVLWVGSEVVAARFSTSDRSLASRVDVWRDAASVAADFPLAGTGLATFEYVFSRYRSGGGGFREVHNDYLQLVVEGGVLVGVPAAFLVMRVRSAVARRFARWPQPEHFWLRAGSVAGLAGLAVQEVVEFGLRSPGVAVLAAVLVALALHDGVEAA